MAGGSTGWILAFRNWLVSVARGRSGWISHDRIALLEAQQAVLKQIAAGSPLQQSLDRICRFVEELDAPALCSVVLLEADKYLRTLSAPSLPPAYSAAIDGMEIGPQAGSCGTAMWRRQTVVVSDIERDPLWRDYRAVARQHGLRACWSRPIFGAAGKLLGSFALYDRAPSLPSARAHEIMEVAAGLAAVAIERAILDEQLSISRSRYELAQRVARLALWQRDFKTGQIYWSPEFRSMLDLPEDVQPALQLGYERVLEQDRPRLVAMHEQAARTGRSYEIQYQVRWRDGTLRHVSERGGASHAADGSLQALAAAVQDETERHDATVKLAALAQAAQQVNSQRSLPRLLSFVAGSARELSGAQFACVSIRHGTVNLSESNGVAPDHAQHELPARVWTLLQSHQGEPQPLCYLRGQHEDSLLQRGWWSMPLHAHDGAVLGFLAVADKSSGDFGEEDEGMLRQLADIAAISVENMLLYADLEARVRERTHELEQSNRDLEAFSYSVSHDLRSPLRAIDGFASLLEQEHAAQLDTEALDYLQRINASIRRMSNLIDDLLELGRVGRMAMTREPVDLSALAAACAMRVAEQYPERQVQLEISPGMTVAADARLMEVVLTNLLDNAWKFTRDQSPAQVTVGAEMRAGEQMYYVADNGAGFDPRHTEQLFGAFQRLHSAAEFPGTGVGLATVQRIIHRHGGQIFAEGTPGGGARVFFTIPAR
ncbi:MAG: GAF domain-containing protein [Steroidobacteraceae bacterium]